MLDKICKLSYKINKGLRLGTPCCDDEALITLLINKADVSCLNNSDLIKYNDLVKTLSFDCHIKHNKVLVTDNNKEEWERNNVECISRKQWEKIALKICNQYKIEIINEKIENTCNVSFDILKETLNCEVLTTISTLQKICDLNIIIDFNKDKCNIEYKLLLEKYPTCNLNVKEYYTLIKSGYSFEIISNLYKNKVYLEIDNKGKVNLKTHYNNYILPNDLKFKDIIIDDKNNIQIVKRIIDDFNISEKTKKQILDGICII